jgi:hypothetical protein
MQAACCEQNIGLQSFVVVFAAVFIQSTIVETDEAHFMHYVGYNWLLRV